MRDIAFPKIYVCTWFPKMDEMDALPQSLSDDIKALLSIVTVFRLGQPMKASELMYFTLFGMVIDVRPLQFSKAR